MPTEQGDATGCNRVLQQGLPFDIVGVPVLDKSELVVPLGFEKMVIMLSAMSSSQSWPQSLQSIGVSFLHGLGEGVGVEGEGEVGDAPSS